jgi:hypothetical protein
MLGNKDELLRYKKVRPLVLKKYLSRGRASVLSKDKMQEDIKAQRPEV